MSSRVLDTVIVTFFLVATAALSVYALHLYVLVLLFWRRRQRVRVEQQAFLQRYLAETPPEQWLGVTSQVPIYNEADVATRVINAVAEMDYSPGLHSIQVLDDSTDETRLLVDQAVRRLRERGVDIAVLRRDDRAGFKAGALKAGLAHIRHPLVAIFDADFVPPKDFLKRATPLLARDERLACIQGRWAHLNPEESWLTRAQALALDGHFALEQGARAWNGLMMNFNGTGGIWRKAAIEDPAVGGWSADTLTEDLDLSYRAQLAGWTIDFSLELACPAELPGNMKALKAQQRRWATGGAQTAVKLLPRIWRAPQGLGRKLEASIHLTHYFVALWMVFLCLMVRPMLVMVDPAPYIWCFLTGWTMVVLSTLAPAVTYAYARHVLGGNWLTGLRTVPMMMVLGTGLSINNAWAVLKGLSTRGGEFVRTPKSGTTRSAGLTSRYKAPREPIMWFLEMLLGAYCLANFAICLATGRLLLCIFLAMYSFAFLVTGWLSRPEASLRRRLVLADEPPAPAPVLEPVASSVQFG